MTNKMLKKCPNCGAELIRNESVDYPHPDHKVLDIWPEHPDPPCALSDDDLEELSLLAERYGQEEINYKGNPALVFAYHACLATQDKQRSVHFWESLRGMADYAAASKDDAT